MSAICMMKEWNHSANSHICLINYQECAAEQDNDTCVCKNYAEKNDYEAASEYARLGSPYVKGACKLPCCDPAFCIGNGFRVCTEPHWVPDSV